MEIYARPNHIVQYVSPSLNYYLPTKENAEKHLTLGNIYTVERTSVNRSSTIVYLIGYKDIPFSSSQFIDAIKQPEHWRQGHIDYWYWKGAFLSKRRNDLLCNYPITD